MSWAGVDDGNDCNDGNRWRERVGGLEGKSGGEVRRGEVRGGWGEEGMRV